MSGYTLDSLASIIAQIVHFSTEAITDEEGDGIDQANRRSHGTWVIARTVTDFANQHTMSGMWAYPSIPLEAQNMLKVGKFVPYEERYNLAVAYIEKLGGPSI